jgi:hypothetical protein
MSKGWIGRLLSLEAEEPPSDVAGKAAGQLRDPTLDERASLYLRAVHGKRDFGSEAYSDARNRILDAMAAHIVESVDTSGVPADDPVETATARLATLLTRPSESLAAACARPSSADRSAASAGVSELHQRSGVLLRPPNSRSRPLSKYFFKKVNPLSITLSVGAALIVVAGTFALLKNIDSASSVAGLDKLEKQAKLEGALDSSQKQANTQPLKPPPVEAQTSSGTPVQKLSPDDAELMKRGQELTRGEILTYATAAAKETHGREIIAGLVQRGNELMSAGKISDARALLNIAAEANDATAAFVLATTYDPIVLDKVKSRDSEPDFAIARLWYERAAALGSTEALNWLKTTGNR